MEPSRTPTLVSPRAKPEASTPHGKAQDNPVETFVTALVEAVRREPSGAGGPPRHSPVLWVVAAAVMAWVLQRAESAHSLAQQASSEHGAAQAVQRGRLDAMEKALAQQQREGARRDNTLREALYVLSEDSRAEWGALVQIHRATAPEAPELQLPSTADRLQALRESLVASHE